MTRLRQGCMIEAVITSKGLDPLAGSILLLMRSR